MSLENLLEENSEILRFKILNNHIYYSSISDSKSSKNKDSALWGKLFDLSYQKMESKKDALTNTEVWKNSYDGSNISENEMSEWLNNTASRINKLVSKDSKVLEIGFGNGLIFNNIIDNVSHYTGTEVAENGLKIITNSDKGIENKHKINLFQLDALNIDKLPDEKYDVIIINSVAQYFPSLDYVFSVFEKLEKYTGSYCKIFLGDIRSLELQTLFYYDVVKNKFKDLSSEELLNRIEILRKRENETFYHTKFFNLLPIKFSYIDSAKVELKEGKHTNELNSYRYDVTLSCHQPVLEKEEININYRTLNNPELELTSRINDLKENEVLEVTNIPNKHVSQLEKGYNEVFSTNMNSDATPLIPEFFFNLTLNNPINIDVRTSENNIFEYNIQFSKDNFLPSKIKLENLFELELCNRWKEKKSSNDLNFEKIVVEKFPEVKLTKVSRFLV